jgi:hypothetical protein
VMWAHYAREWATGRAPTGAELDRVAGTNNYGRAVLSRWRRDGRISAGACHAGRPAERDGRKAHPSGPAPAEHPPATHRPG